MGNSVAAGRKQKIWHEEIPFWTKIYEQLQRGDKVYVVGLIAFLTPMSKCPPRILDELHELVSENEHSAITLNEFLLIATSGRPASVSQRRFYRGITVAANVYTGTIQRARMVRMAMVDYPAFLIPLLFFGAVSLTQIVTFLHHMFWCCPGGSDKIEDYFRFDNKFILSAERKRETWRTVSLVLFHANGLSLVVNVAVQLLVCLPLGSIHSPWKVPVLYMAGAFTSSQVAYICGSLFMVGASGAVYAVLWGHVADVVVNHSQFPSAVGRVLLVLLFTAADVAEVHYLNPVPSLGTLPHATGVLVGLTMGVAVLHKSKGRTWEKIIIRGVGLFYVLLIAYSIALITFGSTM
ncbi:rhomboid-related protein 2-like [Haemaphysalis longicornis]